MLQNQIIKRKRSPNFTQDEKLQFVRIVQEAGICIFIKVTSHDATTNKKKEEAWQNITKMLNACSNTSRTTDTLKKLWQKLKTDAKIYKGRDRYTNGTGGGPSKSYDDPVLDLVVEITGRGSTGILNVQDCDDVLDESAVDDTFIDENQIPDNEIIFNNASEIITEELLNRQIPKKEENSLRLESSENGGTQQNKVNHLKRRQPNLSKPNERYEVIKARAKASNAFAAERLKAEREKTDVILQQKQQMVELHTIKMENENLKKELFLTLINKIKNGDTQTAEAAIFSLNGEI